MAIAARWLLVVLAAAAAVSRGQHPDASLMPVVVSRRMVEHVEYHFRAPANAFADCGSTLMVTGAEGTDQNRSMGRFALDGAARAGPGNRSAVYRNDARIALFETAAGRWTVGPLGAQVDDADMIQARHSSTCSTDVTEPCGYSCPTDPAKWAVERGGAVGPPDADPAVTLTVSCMADCPEATASWRYLAETDGEHTFETCASDDTINTRIMVRNVDIAGDGGGWMERAVAAIPCGSSGRETEEGLTGRRETLHLVANTTYVVGVRATPSTALNPNVVSSPVIRLRISAPTSSGTKAEFDSCMSAGGCLIDLLAIQQNPTSMEAISIGISSPVYRDTGMYQSLEVQNSNVDIALSIARIVISDPSGFSDMAVPFRSPASEKTGERFRQFVLDPTIRNLIGCIGHCVDPHTWESFTTCPPDVVLEVAAGGEGTDDLYVPMPEIDMSQFTDGALVETFGSSSTADSTAESVEASNRCLLDPSGAVGPADALGCSFWRSDGATSMWEPVQVGVPLTVGLISQLDHSGTLVRATCNTTVTIRRTSTSNPQGFSWSRDLASTAEIDAGSASIPFMALDDGVHRLYVAGRPSSLVCRVAALDAVSGAILWSSHDETICGGGLTSMTLIAPHGLTEQPGELILTTVSHSVIVLSAGNGTVMKRFRPLAEIIETPLQLLVDGTSAATAADFVISPGTITGSGIVLNGGSVALFKWSARPVEDSGRAEIHIQGEHFFRRQIGGTDLANVTADIRSINSADTVTRFARYHGSTADQTDLLLMSALSLSRNFRQEALAFQEILAFNTTSNSVQWRINCSEVFSACGNTTQRQLHVVQNGTALRLLVLSQSTSGPPSVDFFDLNTGDMPAPADRVSFQQGTGGWNVEPLEMYGTVGGQLITSPRLGLMYWLDCPQDARMNCFLAAFATGSLVPRFNTTMPFTRIQRDTLHPVPSGITMDDAGGTIYVTVADSRVIALDAETGQAAFQLGFSQPTHAEFLAEQPDLKDLFHQVASSPTTGRVFTVDYEMRVAGFGFGAEPVCNGSPNSVSVANSERWSWPVDPATQQYIGNPIGFDQQVTGRYSISAPPRTRSSSAACGADETGYEYHRVCRDSLPCTSVPSGGVVRPLDMLEAGLNVVHASRVIATREISTCAVQINVTGVSPRRTVNSVQTGGDASVNITFDRLLINATGTVVMSRADLASVNATLSGEYNLMVTPHYVDGSNEGFAHSISISGVFENADIQLRLAVSDRGGTDRVGSVTLETEVLIKPLDIECPQAIVVDAWGSITDIAVRAHALSDDEGSNYKQLQLSTAGDQLRIVPTDASEINITGTPAVEFVVSSSTDIRTNVSIITSGTSPQLVVDVRETATNILLGSCGAPLYVVNVTLSTHIVRGVTDNPLDQDIRVAFTSTPELPEGLGALIEFEVDDQVGTDAAASNLDNGIRLAMASLSPIYPTDSATSTTRDLQVKADASQMRHAGRFPTRLQYKIGGGASHLIGGRPLEVEVVECDNDASCSGRGACDLGSDPDDGKFQCVCEDGSSGASCSESETASATGNEATVVSASLGTVLFLMMAALVTFRVHLHRLKLTPLDVVEMQDEVLEGLGMRLPTDIKEHEFGATLRFEIDLDPASIEEPGWTELQRLLRSTLVRNLPRRVDELMRSRFVVSRKRHDQLLLVIPRPRGAGKQSDVAERFVAALAKLASKHKLVVGPNSVSGVSIALPITVPRELHRSQLTWIKNLGEGAFGVVDLYQIDEPKRGVPPYKAAVKTVKPGSTVGNDELLREALLMALIQHRYVVGIVGIITTPRDLPALIILQLCEGGELLSHVIKSGPDGITTTKRLTFAAQIALGMQYIATRNIVHRDLAARNILLDAVGHCKVSDFGMSASLVHAGKTYAATYVRIHEEIALRWAAPEALQDKKFSAASDVWAFGVTIWEIFACGASEPYSEMGLGEVGPFVRSGGQLGVPSATCPADVYADLLLPCWSFDSNARPGFDELYDTAVSHGALEDAITIEQRKIRLRSEALVRHGSSSSRAAGTAAVADPADRAMLGVSIHFLDRVLVGLVTKMVGECLQLDHPRYRQDFSQHLQDQDPAAAGIWHTVEGCAKPLSLSTVCPRDGAPGAAFVDTEIASLHVNHSTAFLSYAWHTKIKDVAATLVDWCESDQRDLERCWIWMDCLCLNQHRLENAPALSPEVLQETFGSRVAGIGQMVVLLDPWDNPVYISRAWCLFEFFSAIRMSKSVHIDIVLSPDQRVKFRSAIRSGGYSVVDGALNSIRAENAGAREQADLDAIRALIKGFPGGFDTLNGVVKQRLRQWFESQGGIRRISATQVQALPAGSRATATYPIQRTLPAPSPLRGTSNLNYRLAEAAFGPAAAGYIAIGGAGTSLSGKAANGGIMSITMVKRANEEWGIGVRTDPSHGIVVNELQPGGAGARHNLEVGSTFTKVDGVDARRLDKAGILHTMKTKTTITVELGPVIQNIGDPAPPTTTLRA